MLTYKITLPYSPQPVIISKNPGFRALYLARQNKFYFFRLINTEFFSFLAAGFFTFCPKNDGFVRVCGGMQTPDSYAYDDSLICLVRASSFSWASPYAYFLFSLQ